MAVAVSESSSTGLPRDAAHAGVAKESSFMVVFGNSEWITDTALTANSVNYDLFTSCLTWLRGGTGVGKSATDKGKTREVYNLNVPKENIVRLAYLPLGLILLGVVGLGCGVWVVRRR
jgi:hypothetical protein